jgi:hypothetical protein
VRGGGGSLQVRDRTWPVRSVYGRAIAQAVNRRLPTAVVRVRSQVKSCRIFNGQNGTGAGFLRVLRFPLPILIPTDDPYSSIIQGWYNRSNTSRCTMDSVSAHPTKLKRDPSSI